MDSFDSIPPEEDRLNPDFPQNNSIKDEFNNNFTRLERCSLLRRLSLSSSCGRLCVVFHIFKNVKYTAALYVFVSSQGSVSHFKTLVTLSYTTKLFGLNL